jgi:hypothetical protein
VFLSIEVILPRHFCLSINWGWRDIYIGLTD